MTPPRIANLRQVCWWSLLAFLMVACGSVSWATPPAYDVLIRAKSTSSSTFGVHDGEIWNREDPTTGNWYRIRVKMFADNPWAPPPNETDGCPIEACITDPWSGEPASVVELEVPPIGAEAQAPYFRVVGSTAAVLTTCERCDQPKTADEHPLGVCVRMWIEYAVITHYKAPGGSWIAVGQKMLCRNKDTGDQCWLESATPACCQAETCNPPNTPCVAQQCGQSSGPWCMVQNPGVGCLYATPY